METLDTAVSSGSKEAIARTEGEDSLLVGTACAGPAAPSSASLKALAVRGAIWTVSGFGASQVIRLASNLVMTRLLFPEAFGLMALVNVFLYGLQMFSDVGIGPALIRHHRGEEPLFMNTAWTIQAGRGLLLWLGSCAIAAPLSWIYHQPLLAYLIPVAGLTAFISGFDSTALVAARRNLRLASVTWIELFSQILGLAVAMGWAFMQPTVWVLVGSSLVSTATRTATSHFWLPGDRNRFAWDGAAVRELASFGKWIFLASAIFFIGQQVDRLLLGSLVGTAMLGVYSVGLMLAEVPVNLNSRLTRQVAYPTLSRIFRDRRDAVRAAFYRIRLRSDALFLPAIGFMMTCGTAVVRLLYDNRYQEAGWIFQALCLRSAMRCILEPCETCVVALGHPRYAFAQHVARLIWLVVAIPMGWYLGRLYGLVCSVSLMEFSVLPVLWLGLHRHGVLDLGREALAWLMILIGAVAGVTVSEVLFGM